MKINRTKFRETIEIPAKELEYMLFARSLSLREYASEILTILKRSNQHNDKPDDHMFNFYSENKTAGKKAPDMTKGTLAELINSLNNTVDKKFKEYGNTEAKIGVNLAKEESEDESCIICGIDFGPNPFHYEMKSQTEIVENIKKKERGKVIEEVFDILRKNTVDKTGIADDIKKLIRKDNQNDRS